MAQVASIGVRKLIDILSGPEGLQPALAGLANDMGVEPSAVAAAIVAGQNVAAEVLEKSAGAGYPSMQVYCERVVNSLREKFRTFSGKARMVVEARVSQDRIEGIEAKLQLYVDAATQVLDGNRGDWGQGMFYTGGYEVSYSPVRHGGRNFLQTAKVVFEIDISK
ncbi:MAG: hypothetical protein ABI823_07620 [Bryobacteraceae bacterium]